ncbi:hypothetical protein PsYK624_157390 [Phanerochaete sordida]|uniref:F-box domain-containing protein n=1 Tax=Phanerochaete sordida TaxID=48140 RepID=A0A9P3LLK0_9APHY|nr:hypothetical protein PsYK624_157390 [Phanerochaete sordida]
MPSDHLPNLVNSRPDATRLPQELVDQVIGELHDDMTALEQCSLVAKDWLSTASSLLLRRVRWPPCENRGSDCARSSSAPSCTYTLSSKNSFVLCLEILSSSPRLQNSVRELVCVPPHGDPGKTDATHTALELKTFVKILSHLPRLEVVDLQMVKLHAGSPPFPARTGRTLKKLSVSNDGDPRWLWDLFPFMTSLRRVQDLVLIIYYAFPQGWPSEPPASKLEIDTLECNQLQDLPGNSDPHSFCAGLMHHLHLQTLRRFSADILEPSFAGIISNAPSLESLGLRASGRGHLQDLEMIPPRLSDVDISCSFSTYEGSIGCPDANGTWIRIWRTLRAATALPVHKIFVNASVVFVTSADSSHEHLYAYYEKMVSQITDWHTPTSVLDGFGRLEKITFEIRFSIWPGGFVYHPLQVHECHVAAMRAAMVNGLPRRYVDMLHVRAAGSKVRR